MADNKTKGKKKQNTLSLEQKVEIIQKLERDVMAKGLAAEHGVAESTISYIKKKKSEILASVAKSVHEVNKKTLRKPENEEMEDQLYKWFDFQRAKHCPLSADLIKSKA